MLNIDWLRTKLMLFFYIPLYFQKNIDNSVYLIALAENKLFMSLLPQ